MNTSERQIVLDQSSQQFTQFLQKGTGISPVACIIIVHWPDGVQFSAVMANVPPQVQLNAVDMMLKQLNKIGSALKVKINTMRHGVGKPSGGVTQ